MAVYAPLEELAEALRAGAVDARSQLAYDIAAARLAVAGRKAQTELRNAWGVGVDSGVLEAVGLMYARRWAAVDFVLTAGGALKAGDLAALLSANKDTPDNAIYTAARYFVYETGTAVWSREALTAQRRAAFEREGLSTEEIDSLVRDTTFTADEMVFVLDDVVNTTAATRIADRLQNAPFVMHVGGNALRRLLERLRAPLPDERLRELPPEERSRERIPGERTRWETTLGQAGTRPNTAAAVRAIERALAPGTPAYGILSALALDSHEPIWAVEYFAAPTAAAPPPSPSPPRMISVPPGTTEGALWLRLEGPVVFPDFVAEAATAPAAASASAPLVPLVRVPAGVHSLLLRDASAGGDVVALRALRTPSYVHGLSGMAVEGLVLEGHGFEVVLGGADVGGAAGGVIHARARVPWPWRVEPPHARPSIGSGASVMPYVAHAAAAAVVFLVRTEAGTASVVALTSEAPARVVERLHVAAAGDAPPRPLESIGAITDSPALDAYFHAPWRSLRETEQVVEELMVRLSSALPHAPFEQRLERKRVLELPRPSLLARLGTAFHDTLVEYVDVRARTNGDGEIPEGVGYTELARRAMAFEAGTRAREAHAVDTFLHWVGSGGGVVRARGPIHPVVRHLLGTRARARVDTPTIVRGLRAARALDLGGGGGDAPFAAMTRLHNFKVVELPAAAAAAWPIAEHFDLAAPPQPTPPAVFEPHTLFSVRACREAVAGRALADAYAVVHGADARMPLAYGATLDAFMRALPWWSSVAMPPAGVTLGVYQARSRVGVLALGLFDYYAKQWLVREPPGPPHGKGVLEAAYEWGATEALAAYWALTDAAPALGSGTAAAVRVLVPVAWIPLGAAAAAATTTNVDWALFTRLFAEYRSPDAPQRRARALLPPVGVTVVVTPPPASGGGGGGAEATARALRAATEATLAARREREAAAEAAKRATAAAAAARETAEAEAAAQDAAARESGRVRARAALTDFLAIYAQALGPADVSRPTATVDELQQYITEYPTAQFDAGVVQADLEALISRAEAILRRKDAQVAPEAPSVHAAIESFNTGIKETTTITLSDFTWDHAVGVLDRASSHYAFETDSASANIVAHAVTRVPAFVNPAVPYPYQEGGLFGAVERSSRLMHTLDSSRRSASSSATARLEYNIDVADYFAYRRLFVHPHAPTGVLIPGALVVPDVPPGAHLAFTRQLGVLPYMVLPGLASVRSGVIAAFLSFATDLSRPGGTEIWVVKTPSDRLAPLELIRYPVTNNTMQALSPLGWDGVIAMHTELAELLGRNDAWQKSGKSGDMSADDRERFGRTASALYAVVFAMAERSHADPGPAAVTAAGVVKFGDPKDVAHLVADAYLTHLTYVDWHVYNDGTDDANRFFDYANTNAGRVEWYMARTKMLVPRTGSPTAAEETAAEEEEKGGMGLFD